MDALRDFAALRVKDAVLFQKKASFSLK